MGPSGTPSVENAPPPSRDDSPCLGIWGVAICRLALHSQGKDRRRDNTVERVHMEQATATQRYYAGIDLALRADHLARLLDDRGRAVGRPLRFGRTYDEMEAMFQTLTDRVPEGCEIIWGCEATGAAWKLVCAFLQGKGQQVSLENPAGIAALRDVDYRFFKNDDVDAGTIAEMVLRKVRRGIPLRPVPSALHQATRSLARDIDKLGKQLSRIKTRFSSLLCDLLLPSLKPSDHEWASPTLLPVLSKYADPREIAGKGLKTFIKCAKKIGGPRTSEAALMKLHAAAVDAVRCYGEAGLHYEAQAFRLRDAIEEIRHIQERREAMSEQLQELLAQARTEADVEHGLTVTGVGQASLDTLIAIYGPPNQWPTFKAMKRLAGTVPTVDRSGNSDGHQRMNKLGEPVLRTTIFQMGNVARRYDAYFAAKYHEQMVHKGKGHAAACIATGLQVLNCLRAVLRDQRAYVHRDPQTGEVITKEQSRELAQTVYLVPEEVRADRAKRKRNAHQQPKKTTNDTRHRTRNAQSNVQNQQNHKQKRQLSQVTAPK